MAFDHPWLLWLLSVAPLITYACWRAGGPRRRLNAALRLAALTALVLALAGPVVARWSVRPTVVSVIDLSASVSDSSVADAVRALPPEGDDAPVVAFANRAAVLASRADLTDPSKSAGLRQRLAEPLWPDDSPAGGSNLAAALSLAAAQVPVDGRGEVRLWSGGTNDHGDAAAEAWRLAERGIPVVTTAVEASESPAPVRVTRVALSGRARVGQTVRATVTVVSAVNGRATIRVRPGSATAITTTIAVAPGANRLTVDVPMTAAGLVPVYASASLDAAPAAPDAALAAVEVRPAARVLLVQSAQTPGVESALAAALGDGVQIAPITPAALAARDINDADAVVIADVPAERIPAPTQAALRDAVRGGTGLLLTGAARSFGPGGYDDSMLAPLLPVKMPQQGESVDPSTTLVLIVDTSGSMFGDRIDLAKEVARLAMSHLKPHDKVGVVEFYGGKRWAAPIQSAGNVAIIQRALDRLNAGGGTTLYPAVEEAAFALRNVHTRSKHLLILSDGMVERAPFPALVRQMAEDGISVSTAQVGMAENDGGSAGNQMADLARWGNGRFYTVPNPYALPDIQFKQPQVSLTSPLVRKSTNVAAGDDPLVRDLAADAFAPIQGYVRTVAKPTADVLLKTESGDPIVARWRYGAGFVAAVPTQLGSAMTASAQDNAAFGRLLAGLVRQLDDTRGDALAATATVRPAGVEIDISATTPAAAASSAPVRMALTDEAGTVLRGTSAEPVAPGRWNVLLPGVTAGVYGLRFDAGGAAGRAGVAVAPPQTALPVSDRSLLERIESFSGQALSRRDALPQRGTAWLELRPALAALSVLLLVAFVAARRWPVSSGR